MRQTIGQKMVGEVSFVYFGSFLEPPILLQTNIFDILLQNFCYFVSNFMLSNLFLLNV